MAVGNQNTAAGGKTIIFSPDNGVTWASSTNGFNTHNGFSDRGWGVAYGNNVWMAVGHYSTSIGYERWINGNWVAVGYLGTGDSKTIKYSSDNGATWTDTTTLAANLFSMGQSVTYQPLSNGGI